MHRRVLFSGLGVIGLAACAFSGCVFGPNAIRLSRGEYNTAIQQTTNEQLLLNLVRLRYRDVPYVLQVGTIAAQFQFEQSVGLQGTAVENVGPGSALTPDNLRVSGNVAFIDRPTVTFTPLQGSEFVQRMLKPLSLDTIIILQNSGWSIGRVLRLTVQRMNGLQNATRASGPTPPEPPIYKDFKAAAELLRQLQVRDQLAMGMVMRLTPLSDPIPVAGLDATALVAAADAGYSFRSNDDGATFVLEGSRPSIRMLVAEDALTTPDAKELFKLLRLSGDQTAIELKLSASAFVDSPAQQAQRDAILIDTRSLMGIMFYLSQAVDVPERHEEQGLVTVTRDASGLPFEWALVTGDLLRIQHRRFAPRTASVSVRYRGYWFYIDDADLESKSTFTLLSQLFALQAGVGESKGPLLTLPI